jgi:hypothetical protein
MRANCSCKINGKALGVRIASQKHELKISTNPARRGKKGNDDQLLRIKIPRSPKRGKAALLSTVRGNS